MQDRPNRKKERSLLPAYTWGAPPEGVAPPSALWEHEGRPLWVQASAELGGALLMEKTRIVFREARSGSRRWDQETTDLPDEVLITAKAARIATGRDLRDVDPNSGVIRWRQRTGGAVTGMAADNTRLYVSTKGPLLALDPKDGKVVWRAGTAWEPDLVTLPEAGLLLVNNPETETVEAYRSADGTRVWEFSSEGQPVTVGAAVGGVVAVSRHADGASGVDLATGQARWTLESERVFETPAVTLNGRLLLTDGDAYSVDPGTGAVQWTLRLADEDDKIFTLRAAGEMLFAETWRGRLLALNPEDGGILWERRLGQVHGVAWGGDRLYIRLNSQREGARWSVEAVDAGTGKALWEFCASGMIADVTVIGDVLVVELKGRAVALDLKTA